MKFVKQNGFDFSKEELEQVKTQLSEDELSAVAGGFESRKSCECGGGDCG